MSIGAGDVWSVLANLETSSSVESVQCALSTLGDYHITDVRGLVCMLRLVHKLDSLQSEEHISQKIPNMLMEVWTKYLLLLKKYAHMFGDHSEIRELIQLIAEALLRYAQSGLLLLIESTSEQDSTTAAKLKYVFFICQRVSATLSVSGRCAVEASSESLAFLALASFRGLSSLQNMDGEFIAMKGEDLLVKALGPSSRERFPDLLQRAFQSLAMTESRMKPLATLGLCHSSCLYIEKTTAADDPESVQAAVSTILRCLLCLSCAHITSVKDEEIWKAVRRLADSLLALEASCMVTLMQVHT